MLHHLSSFGADKLNPCHAERGCAMQCASESKHLVFSTMLFSTRSQTLRPFVLMLVACTLSVSCVATAQTGPLPHTQVVVLGTGTPEPYPDRSGPAVAIVVNGAAYLVDCGPGVVRRAEAADQNGIKALNVKNLKIVFIT